MMPKFLLAASSFAIFIGIGCSSHNLLQNGSFEKGREPWFSMVDPNWNGFEVRDQYAIDGRHSVHLALRGEMGTKGTMIFGVTQEVTTSALPKRFSGYYRVENWKRGTTKQYLQFVVILWGEKVGLIIPNVQIRYILGGIITQPFPIANARFIFLGGKEPKQSTWVNFSRDLQADFIEKWGEIPRGIQKIQVFFEARYDAKAPEESNIYADVYFDKIFLGD